MENQKEQETSRVRDEVTGRILPGHTLNPNGRPKGSFSIKDRLRQYLEEHPEDMAKFVHFFATRDRSLGWRMLEGNPNNNTDITSGGLPIPILGHVPNNNGNEEDTGAQETH